MTESLPLVHVERPLLPWRTQMLTECGLPTEGHPVITRDAFIAKVKKLGVQRASMTTCMTCFNTAQRHPTFEDNPSGAMIRECESWRPKPLVQRELRALAALVGRHREEFEELMQDQEEIVPIGSVKPKQAPRGPRSKW